MAVDAPGGRRGQYPVVPETRDWIGQMPGNVSWPETGHCQRVLLSAEPQVPQGDEACRLAAPFARFHAQPGPGILELEAVAA